MIIKDLDLMKDISPLFEKKVIIWGIGNYGCAFLRELKDMGGGKEGIVLCDSDRKRWGEQKEGIEIISPEAMQEFVSLHSVNELVLCIAIDKIKKQDEVLSMLECMKLDGVAVYTQYALEWGIYLNINNPYVAVSYRNNKVIEHEKRRITYDENWMFKDMHYFAYAPLHNDEMILVYQPGKVGSMTVYRSIEKYGKYVLHTHKLVGLEYERTNNLQKLLKLKSAKMISLVREPLSRQISHMWENIPNVNRYSAEVDFAEIEQFYFEDDFEKEEFEWFYEELESVFDINIYEYPFDKEAGYSIIKKNNIELLLIKMEKLNELEKVIGDFLNIPDFVLENKNLAEEKTYRFAYREYLKQFSISRDTLQHIYFENEFIKFFYTDQEIDAFYRKWLERCGI